LFELEILREISQFLRIFERMMFGVGRGSVLEAIVVQIYEDILRLYKLYSETVAQATSIGWENVKLMRRVKGDCLRLISTFVDVSVKPKGMKADANQVHAVAANIVPRLLDYVLEDYTRAKPQARDHEVLLLLRSLSKNLSESISPAVGVMFEKLFNPTREMLIPDSRGFPEHRIAFYELLKNFVANCFNALLVYLLQSDQLGIFLETIVVGIQNEHPQVADTSLAILNQFLDSLGKLPVTECNTIYVRIFNPLVAVILSVMTDKLHDSGKEAQIRVLMHLLSVVASGKVELSIELAESHMNKVISEIGPRLVPAQREAFVRALMVAVRGDVDTFRQLMNDLKITICYGGSLDL
jgi:exportin-1